MAKENKKGSNRTKKSPLKLPGFLGAFLLRGLLIIFFIALLAFIISYARGYRINFHDKTLEPSGILAVNSTPKAAKVYVNGNLKGVTDLNLSLPADTYKIEIKKEGYTDWSQQVKLQGEIVISMDALLFPRNPSLSPLTSLGIVKAIPVDQTDKIILFAQNNAPDKDGIYIFDASRRPISFLPPLKLITLKSTLPADIDFNQTTAYFDPQFKQTIVEFTAPSGTYSYLFSLQDDNASPFDVTSSKDAIIQAWDSDKNKEIVKILETFPKEIKQTASDSFKIISFSPDKTKMLYQATQSTILPRVLIPSLIGSNQTQEERTLRKDSIYIYDRKEDKNFPVPVASSMIAEALDEVSPRVVRSVSPTPTPIPSILPIASVELKNFSPLLWYPDSRHIGVLQEKQIVVLDYDGSNRRTLYAGPFEKDFFLLTSDGRLLILTNLNPLYNAFADLYEVGIK